MSNSLDMGAAYKAQRLLARLGHPDAQLEKEADAATIAKNVMRAEGTVNKALKALGIGGGMLGTGYLGHEIGKTRGIEEGRESGRELQREADMEQMRAAAQNIFEAGRNFERSGGAVMPQPPTQPEAPPPQTKTAAVQVFDAWCKGQISMESLRELPPADLRKIASYAYKKKIAGSQDADLLWALLQTA